MTGQTGSMIVVVCPGQGSQTPGFLAPWVAEPPFRDHLATMSESVGIDLELHGTQSDAETIRDTAIAQPLIVAAGLLTLAVLLRERRHLIAGVAGHSVGEVTAAVAAGIITETDGLSLVRERGDAMARAAAVERTGMSAVLGGAEDELLEKLTALGLEPANFNGAGQIVVAGALDALAQLAAAPPARSRVVPLAVAGAFHTRYMQPAVESLRHFSSGLKISDPTLPIWSNRDGARVATGSVFIDQLVGQVSSPVRWDKTMDAFSAAGITGMIEIAPAGALVGLSKRALTGVPTVAVRTPDDLAAAFDLIDGKS